MLQGLEAKKDTERAAAKTGSHWAKENEADAAERTRQRTDAGPESQINEAKLSQQVLRPNRRHQF
jgi:hypothetical protein